MSEPVSGPDGQEPRAEDAAWRDIVAHFGERAELPTSDVEPESESGGGTDELVVRRPIPRPADDPDRWEPSEHFIPPTPPPAPRPTGPRGAAWIGLFGSPTVMLICLVLGISLPAWAGFLLFASFLGGFGYLIATMRKNDDSDPWDDGAVV